MATRTEFARLQSGNKYYAQERPGEDVADWAASANYGVEDPVASGQYVFSNLDYSKSYEVYEEATLDTPAPTDLAVWEFLGPQGAVVEAGLGSGPLALTVEVKDDLGSGIASAVVSIVNTNYQGVTDAFGNVVFNLPSATYDVRVQPPSQYTAPDDQQIVLSTDSTLSFTLQGVPATEAPGWLG